MQCRLFTRRDWFRLYGRQSSTLPVNAARATYVNGGEWIGKRVFNWPAQSNEACPSG